MRRSVLMTAVLAGLAGSMILASVQRGANAHCEVPCGIYDDHARITAMLEDTTTITKAMDQIRSLAGAHAAQSQNQATRWIMTKEEHATRIQHTISQYFLTQRVKPAMPNTPAWDDYTKRLAEHHAVLVAAMKTKQSVNPAQAAALRSAIEAISGYYAPEGDHDHPPSNPAPNLNRGR